MSVDVQTLAAAQDKGLVVGVVPSSGSTALRLEIDDLISDTELANLYFLALEAFMNNKNDASKNPFSYYEISGIHGSPARAWDNVSSVKYPESGGKSSEEGYCHHGSALFPLWHRVYLAQFEQALYLHAADIAQQLNAESVLDRFRVPYWDPLLPRQISADGNTFTYGVPVIFTLPEIQVRRPDNPNTWVPMANPLYQFDFPDYTANPSEKFDWSGFKGGRIDESEAMKKTIRGLDASRADPKHLTVQANHSFVMQTFDDNYNPFTKLSSEAAGQLWRVMLDDTQTWLSMSNHSYTISDELGAQSLEGFHDNMHVQLGQGPITNSQTGQYQGHMSDPRYAGFDPTFWLHHCNIDRLLAIWQGIKSNAPDSVAWWTSYPNPRGTFVEPRNEHETPTTPLAPFRKESNDQGGEPVWWTSTAVRDHTTLGYDYPTIAAARQSGDLVQGLTRWANAELGWADPSGSSAPGDSSAIQKLENQIRAPVAAFPKTILVDGRTPFKDGNNFVSSQSTGDGPVSGASVESRSFSAKVVQPIKAAVASVASAVPADITTIVNPSPVQSEPSSHLHQQVLAKALPTGDPAFKDRFGSVKGVIKDGKVTAWNASFSVEKFALNGSFVIYFFLGDFDTDPAKWIHDRHRAASSAVFASTRDRIEGGGCANCAQQAEGGMKYKDTVGLTQALLEYWKSGEEIHGLKVTSLEPEVIVPFLTRNLHWRVIDNSGGAVPRETIPSLKLGVYSETIVLPQRLEDAPLFQNQVMQFDITAGRPGGLNPGESL